MKIVPQRLLHQATKSYSAYQSNGTYMLPLKDSKAFNDSSVAPALSNEAYVVLACFMFAVFISSILFNGVFVYVFLVHDKLKTRPNILLVALCVTSFLISALAIPFVGASSLARRWLFGRNGCVFHAFIVTSLGLTQIAILTVMSIDKYIVIVKTNWSHLVTKSATMSMLFGCVVYGFMFGTYPLLGWNNYTLEVANISCSINWVGKSSSDLSYSLCLLIIGFVLPLSVIFYVYCSIFRMVKQQRSSSERYKGPTQIEVASRRQIRVVKTICLIVASFILSWTPYSIYSVLSVAGYADMVHPLVATLPSMVAKASIIWHPIIYVLRNKIFKKALKETIPCSFAICNAVSSCKIRLKRQDSTESARMVTFRHTSGSGGTGGIYDTEMI